MSRKKNNHTSSSHGRSQPGSRKSSTNVIYNHSSVRNHQLVHWTTLAPSSACLRSSNIIIYNRFLISSGNCTWFSVLDTMYCRHFALNSSLAPCFQRYGNTSVKYILCTSTSHLYETELRNYRELILQLTIISIIVLQRDHNMETTVLTTIDLIRNFDKCTRVLWKICEFFSSKVKQMRIKITDKLFCEFIVCSPSSLLRILLWKPHEGI
jgi:hypothetical protein